ncbi:MAG: DUF6531 domain-containing protein [Planctomycetaceae bacterium]
MLAAKHFDPVLGIDIHLIQPPGPVPPIPIPHPFIGFLIDPFDYVPIVGSTVQINNMHRAQAGTAGRALPPHFPIGGTFIKPPANECEMFMGSATVVIDGDAQSYMALPALSCQCIGMPPIPRLNPKKKSKVKSLVLPTSMVLPIPAGPPVLIGGPPTISMMAMGMKAGMAALGKLGKGLRKLQRGSGRIGRAMRRASTAMRNAAKKAMKKLGVPPSVQNRVSRAICAVTGHPVDIATGKVFTDLVDFRLPGPLPLVWERVYYSTSEYDGPLGHGWHHSYDVALCEDDDGIAVRMSDGRPVVFPRIRIGESCFDRAERLTLLRDEHGYAMRDAAGLTWRFDIVTFDSDVQRLLSVSDRAENRIEFRYDELGRLMMIHDSAGRRLPVTTDADGRILNIQAPHPDDPRSLICLLSCEYDDRGRLRAVRDAMAQPFLFKYDGFLLTRETDRNGLSFYFEYEGSGHSARCVHTWGDGGIYDHQLDYDVDLKRTVVTNSLGHKTVHFWNDSGLVYKSIDAKGNSVQTVYNEFHQPQVELDELGQATTYGYDERGNTSLVTSPDGATVQVSYNDRDQPVTLIDALGCRWSWEYNEFGKLTRRIDATGRETGFEYSRRRLRAIINPAGGATELSYDEDGNLSALTTPDGSQSRWRFDRLGRVVTLIDPAGSEQRREFDLTGRMTSVVEPDGNFRSLQYDAMGNLIYAKDRQREVRFTYQGMGRLASRREAGTTVEFRYNTEESLIGIVNEHGAAYGFELDERGDVAREFGFDDVRRIYTRDDAGRVIRIERASGVITFYKYDPAGRVIAVTHSDKSEERYAYRQDGELIEAINDACEVRFERDAAGRILKETQNDFWVSSKYDALGMRIEMKSCFGAVQTIDRGVTGNVTGFQFADAATDPATTLWQTQIQRDQTGLELERSLPGGIRSRWERDRLGRPVRHQILSATGERRNVAYEWDINDRLRTIVDAHHGTTVFRHDELGNLASATYADGSVELRMPDAVGNLFRTQDRSDRRYGPAGQLLEAKTDDGIIRFEYDAEGNLIRRSTPQGDWHYVWNAAGMLKSVTRPDGEVVEFEYDALGRRVSKTFRGRTTRWIWDGNTPIHEWVEGDRQSASEPATAESASDGTPPAEAALAANPSTGPPADDEDCELLPVPAGMITWLFDPESFAPAAKLSAGQCWSIVTDYLGTPTAMLDESGTVVWSADVSIYGDLRNVRGDRCACPFRWPGQYEDAETGLYYNRFRYYDPEAGHYISQDPIRIAGGLNLFEYANEPNRKIDPFGLITLIHYTDEKGYNGITSSNEMHPSTKPKNARHGVGQYFTDIDPDTVGGKTLKDLSAADRAKGMISHGQLSRELYNDTRRIKSCEYFVEVDLTGLHVENPKPGVFLVKNPDNLDLTGRIKRHGKTCG